MCSGQHGVLLGRGAREVQVPRTKGRLGDTAAPPLREPHPHTQPSEHGQKKMEVGRGGTQMTKIETKLVGAMSSAAVLTHVVGP